MRHRLLLLLLCCIWNWGSLYAQWETAIKSIVTTGVKGNTSLFLQYTEPDIEPSRYVAEISFRLPESHRTIAAKEINIDLSSKRLHIYPFYIPPGTYDVDIDILDLAGFSATNKQMRYQSRVSPQKLSISDIFLTKTPAASFTDLALILENTPTFREGEQVLHFYCEIYSPNADLIPIEATLLAEKTQEQPQVLHYVALQKTVQLLEPTEGKVTVSGKFDIASLDRGQYRILIHVEGSKTVENTANFIIQDNIQEKIRQNVGEAIAMMKYIIPIERVDYLFSIGKEMRWDSLLHTWNYLYPSTDEAPTYSERAMESYYRKLFAFQDSIAHPGENWESDRARIYLMYGVPDGGWDHIRTFTHNGTPYEQWIYSQDNLIFTFEKRNNRYLLLE